MLLISIKTEDYDQILNEIQQTLTLFDIQAVFSIGIRYANGRK